MTKTMISLTFGRRQFSIYSFAKKILYFVDFMTEFIRKTCYFPNVQTTKQQLIKVQCGIIDTTRLPLLQPTSFVTPPPSSSKLLHSHLYPSPPLDYSSYFLIFFSSCLYQNQGFLLTFYERKYQSGCFLSKLFFFEHINCKACCMQVESK